jgi:DNA-binding transcriptional MerR regulator
MENKKYYSISEVTKILRIHDYQLRYLEKISANFTVHKVRGRRYYTNKDIDFLKNSLEQSAKNIPTQNIITNAEILSGTTLATHAKNGKGSNHPSSASFNLSEGSSTQPSYKSLAEAESQNKFYELPPYPLNNEADTPTLKPKQLELQESYMISSKVDSLINKFYKLSIELKKL